MPSPLIVAIPIIGALFLVGVVLAAVILMSKSLSHGLHHLAESYGVHQQPDGKAFHHQTVQIGAAVWKRCVTVVVGHQGLYLGVRPPLGKLVQVLIPWDKFTAAEETTLYWKRVYRLTIGDPPESHVTVFSDVAEAMRPYAAQLPAEETRLVQ